MTVKEWAAIWAVTFTTTGVIVALAFLLGVWSLPIIFGALIVGSFFLMVER